MSTVAQKSSNLSYSKASVVDIRVISIVNTNSLFSKKKSIMKREQ